MRLMHEISKIMVTRIVVCLAISALSGGCIVLPSDLPGKRPFGDDELAFIKVGATSKSMVVDELGSPTWTYSDGSWWNYSANQDLADWVLLDLLFWDSRWGPPNELAEFNRGSRQFHLLLRFDHDDLVRQILVVNENDPCSRDGTICLESDELVLSSLTDNGSAEAKEDFILTPQRPQIEVAVYPGNELDLVQRAGLVYERGREEPYTGTVTTLHKDGWIERTIHYEDGKLNGTKTYWYENGDKRYEAWYVDGYRHGLVTFWDEGESNPRVKCYQNGRIAKMDQCR